MAKFADDERDAVGETVVDNESAPIFDLSSFCLPIFQRLVPARARAPRAFAQQRARARATPPPL